MMTLNDILGKITEADSKMVKSLAKTGIEPIDGGRSFLTLTYKEVYDVLKRHGWEPPDDSTVELIALLVDENTKLREELGHIV